MPSETNVVIENEATLYDRVVEQEERMGLLEKTVAENGETFDRTIANLKRDIEDMEKRIATLETQILPPSSAF